MQRLEVNAANGRYAVLVGHDIIDQVGSHCREAGLGGRVAVLVDRALRDELAPAALASLREGGFETLPVEFTGSDAAKTLSAAEEIIGRLIEADLDRGSWVLALGGGVVGDLAGFVAACYQRGIDFVQVPTTIVAQVDASVGGKTAVNHRLGKNMIGAFHQPRLVFIDTASLRSLPLRERVSGMAEVVKHGIIRDEEMFEFLEEHLEAVVDMSIEADRLDWLIARNIALKAEVVAADPLETGLRKILNYGHTIGHAIEAVAAYEAYNHGEAVILGMVAAGAIAVHEGVWPLEQRQRQDTLLERLGVPAGIGRFDADHIVERTRADKKRRDGKTRMVLCSRIGQAELFDDVDEATIRVGVDYLQGRGR